MKVIGITGNSGSGKSTICEIIKENYNSKIIDADKVAKKLTASQTEYLQEIIKTFGDNIVFLGTATFGGGSYIIFASDLDVRWEDYVSSQIDKELIAGIYQNDHMGYYNQVLYPDHVRQAR